jgi:Ca-activated chloride channel family protein
MMAALIRGVLAGLAMLALTSGAAAADKAIIVLDASGSMWGQIDGKPKLEIARETLRSVLKTLPADLELGLMAYGHREKGSCEDIELVVPPAAGTAGAITATVDSMKFLGKTPLSAAVKQAAEALRYGEDKATVILITDGLETCNADPCAVGTELEQAGVDFTAHVVGFGLTEEEGKQVACLAENTGGEYYQADDADQLGEALVEAVAPEPAPEPEPAPAPEPEPQAEFNLTPTIALSETSPDFGRDDDVAWEVFKANPDGSRGDHVSTDYGGAWKGNLEPGDYIVNARRDNAQLEQKVTIEAGKVAAPHFILNAGTLIIRARPSEGADIEDGAAINVKFGDDDTTGYGQMKAVFPAGDLTLTVTIGQGKVTETIALKAGETIEKDVIVGVGHLVANAFYVAGAKVDDSGMFTEVFKAAKKIDGSRESLSYGYGPDQAFDLPPGDYAVVTKLDQAVAEAPATVKTGERVDVSVVLNAGVLAISAPGATFIEVFGAAKDIQGNRKAFGYAYNENHQTTLPAGDYVVVADRGDNGGKTEATATVKAGERTEVAVP